MISLHVIDWLLHAHMQTCTRTHKHIDAMVFRSGNRVGLAFAHALICHGTCLCLPYRHTDRAHHEPDDTASMIHMHGSNLAASIPLSVVYPASHASTCSSSPVRSMLQSLDDAFHLLHRKSKHITIHYSWACLQATWAQDHTQIRSVGYLSCDNEGLGGQQQEHLGEKNHNASIKSHGFELWTSADADQDQRGSLPAQLYMGKEMMMHEKEQ